MALEDLIAELKRGPVTSVTSEIGVTLQKKPSNINDVTPVTPVTSETTIAEGRLRGIAVEPAADASTVARIVTPPGLTPSGPVSLRPDDPGDAGLEWQGEVEDVPPRAAADFGDETEHDAWLTGTPAAELCPAPAPVRGIAMQYWRAGDPPPPAPPRRKVVPVRAAKAARQWLNDNGFGPVSVSGPDQSPCRKGCIHAVEDCQRHGCQWYRETLGKAGTQ